MSIFRNKTNAVPNKNKYQNYRNKKEKPNYFAVLPTFQTEDNSET